MNYHIPVVKKSSGGAAYLKCLLLHFLIQYLKQLTPVQDVQLLQVTSNSVKLSVLVRGSLATFQQHASIGQRLIPSGSESNENQLVYEWAH